MGEVSAGGSWDTVLARRSKVKGICDRHATTLGLTLETPALDIVLDALGDG